MDIEDLRFLQFSKPIASIHPLISSQLIRVIFTDRTETYVIENKRRGIIEPRKYRRRRLQQS